MRRNQNLDMGLKNTPDFRLFFSFFFLPFLLSIFSYFIFWFCWPFSRLCSSWKCFNLNVGKREFFWQRVSMEVKFTKLKASPESDTFKHFFLSDGLNTLKKEAAHGCKGSLTLQECANSLSHFKNNKMPGSDGFTLEFYTFFWDVIGEIMVDRFNYTFENGWLSISPKLRVISLIPKKDKDKKYLKNWRPISLLNNDYKIATKAIALCLEKVLPAIISPSQTGYIKGRYIGESIRIISDIMSFTEAKNIPGLAVFIDFEKAFDSIEWKFLQKCLEVFNFGPQLKQWVTILHNDIRSCVLNNGFATKHFPYLSRSQTRLPSLGYPFRDTASLSKIWVFLKIIAIFLCKYRGALYKWNCSAQE